LAYRFHERLGGTWASALLVSCYGLASFLSIEPARNADARVVAFAKHANAKRQVARVATWIGPPECGWMRSGMKALFRPSAFTRFGDLLSSGRLLTALAIIRAIDIRHGF